MLSQTNRFIFLGEAKVSTLRGYFDPPTLSDLLHDLDGKRQAELVPPVVYGARTVALRDIAFDNDAKVGLLFRLVDPDIPDNILENIEKNTLREAKREDGEAPALSAHVVFDTSPKFDPDRAYPCAIENIEYLPRSLIASYLTRVLADALGEMRYHIEYDEEREYRPRITFAGHPSKTIANVLTHGGRLHGMHFEKPLRKMMDLAKIHIR